MKKMMVRDVFFFFFTRRVGVLGFVGWEGATALSRLFVQGRKREEKGHRTAEDDEERPLGERKKERKEGQKEGPFWFFFWGFSSTGRWPLCSLAMFCQELVEDDDPCSENAGEEEDDSDWREGEESGEERGGEVEERPEELVAFKSDSFEDSCPVAP